MTEQHIKGIQGLTSKEALELQNKYGKNELLSEIRESFFHKILKVISEPMFLLLIVASIIYFILGEPRDGCVMLVFVVGIIGIEVIQEWKTDKTLSALKDLSAPRITVLRDGERKVINSSELVPGDVIFISEGVKIPADGFVIRASTLRVDESSLTGEAEGVWKISTEENKASTNDYWRKDYCYAGTLVTQGFGVVLVDKIGIETEYGKISKNVISAPPHPTPLQIQTGVLVKICAGIAAVLFLLVAFVTYLNISDHIFTERIIESILSGVTLAMAMIPEEFPVILTVFLSMGAFRLAKKKSLVRKLPSVETLGTVSVLCVDKTGTITMNKMTVSNTWTISCEYERLNLVMGMACEFDAYDPMEKAMISFCEEHGISRDVLFGGELIKDYAFTDELKMMAHVWRNDNEIIVAAKGSPENILSISRISEKDKMIIEEKMSDFSKRGLRVIAVGEMVLKSDNDIPENLEDCSLNFCGLVGLSDPPRTSVKDDIKTCTDAGVRVVMITGDNGVTASAIAKQIDMPNSDIIISGNELNTMSDEELQKKIKDVSIFSRVIPEHKMRIVKAFKANGDVVAMTGDGVNDAPALKYADIGVAMGKRGSEVSREAADLILLDDNFSTIVDTIRDGRRIYDNIRKAVGYVFTIHIPIAFSSLFAPLLGISPANLLLFPLHVVLLELIIDPTCSIVLERQPAEDDIMDRAPLSPKEKLLTAKGFSKSIIQGLVIFGASFGTYLTVLQQNPEDASLARTMGLAIIFFANIFLVQVNSSNYDYAVKSFIKLGKDKVMWAANIGTIVGLLLMLYTPLSEFLKLTPLTPSQFALAICIGAGSVVWYELVKLIKHINKNKKEVK
ncbi:MAG: cation-translocating P-type ATPase [Solirubrobacterales bacterium]